MALKVRKERLQRSIVLYSARLILLRNGNSTTRLRFSITVLRVALAVEEEMLAREELVASEVLVEWR